MSKLEKAETAGYKLIQEIAQKRGEGVGQTIGPLKAGDTIRLVKTMLEAAEVTAPPPDPDPLTVAALMLAKQCLAELPNVTARHAYRFVCQALDKITEEEP